MGPADVKYCVKCGNRIPATSVFCTYCGQRLSEQSEQQFQPEQPLQWDQPVQEEQSVLGHTVMPARAKTVQTAQKEPLQNKQPKKSGNGNRGIMIAVISAAIILLAGIAAFIGVLMYRKSKEITIPDVTGLCFETAREELRSRGFEVVSKNNSQSRISDVVVSQDPEGVISGIEKGETVKVKLSVAPFDTLSEEEIIECCIEEREYYQNRGRYFSLEEVRDDDDLTDELNRLGLYDREDYMEKSIVHCISIANLLNEDNEFYEAVGNDYYIDVDGLKDYTVDYFENELIPRSAAFDYEKVSKSGKTYRIYKNTADDPMILYTDELDRGWFRCFLLSTGSGTAAPAAEAAPAVETPAAEAAAAEPYATGGKIGIAFPTKDLQRWNKDGENIKSQLEAAGYEVDLQYASNDVQTQVSQIENMINNGCHCLIVAPIESDSLETVLLMAKEMSIPVISYDRLIMHTDAVSYYLTFDNYMVGTIQGEYIRDHLNLDSEEGPFNIEFITGDPGDYNARFFYQGAFDVLAPYIDSGKLVVRSGQMSFDEVATPSWSTENAFSRFAGILGSYYSKGNRLDAVVASNDSTAEGVVEALDENYSVSKYGWPLLTGQDCDIAAVRNIIEGRQSMSVFKDTRVLAAQTVKMVEQIMNGEMVDVNDTTTYDNGTGVIPAYLCRSEVVEFSNYKEYLIDSGYYTESDLM